MHWNVLSTDVQLTDIYKLSNRVPVLIFKHSTRCSVSIMAKRGFENDWNTHQEDLIPYYLDIITYRNISNRIAEDLRVRHESPQVILIKNELPVYYASHSDIDFNAIYTAAKR